MKSKECDSLQLQSPLLLPTGNSLFLMHAIKLQVSNNSSMACILVDTLSLFHSQYHLNYHHTSLLCYKTHNIHNSTLLYTHYIHNPHSITINFSLYSIFIYPPASTTSPRRLIVAKVSIISPPSFHITSSQLHYLLTPSSMRI